MDFEIIFIVFQMLVILMIGYFVIRYIHMNYLKKPVTVPAEITGKLVSTHRTIGVNAPSRTIKEFVVIFEVEGKELRFFCKLMVI